MKLDMIIPLEATPYFLALFLVVDTHSSPTTNQTRLITLDKM
jgi:hypothetical protein